MMPRLGLRTLLLIPLLATLVLGSLGLGFYVDRAVRQDMLVSVDTELVRSAGGVRVNGEGRPMRPTEALESVDQPLALVVSANGAVIGGTDESIAVMGADIGTGVALEGTSTIEGSPRYRVLATPQPDGTILLVALSLENLDTTAASLRQNLLLGGIVLVAVQALIVGLVARMVGRPVTRISQAAHRVSSGDLHADLGEPSGPRETAALTEDLTMMLRQLNDTIITKDKAAAEAMQARADMEQFMADASHEMRTPLTALRGYSELFANGMLDAEGVDRAMARIGGESERLTRLVNDLLTLVRPTDMAERRTVDLAAVVSAVAYDLRAAHPTHPITQDLPSTGNVEVVGDPNRLHQAILNLGANACQHTPSGTPVEFRVRSEASGVSVQVIDHGVGIDSAIVEELFVPFARGDESRSRRSHDGAGLGLALVRRIAAQHQGEVTFSHTAGGGATFTLRLPDEPSAPPVR